MSREYAPCVNGHEAMFAGGICRGCTPYSSRIDLTPKVSDFYFESGEFCDGCLNEVSFGQKTCPRCKLDSTLYISERVVAILDELRLRVLNAATLPGFDILMCAWSNQVREIFKGNDQRSYYLLYRSSGKSSSARIADSASIYLSSQSDHERRLNISDFLGLEKWLQFEPGFYFGQPVFKGPESYELNELVDSLPYFDFANQNSVNELISEVTWRAERTGTYAVSVKLELDFEVFSKVNLPEFRDTLTGVFKCFTQNGTAYNWIAVQRILSLLAEPSSSWRE